MSFSILAPSSAPPHTSTSAPSPDSPVASPIPHPQSPTAFPARSSRRSVAAQARPAPRYTPRGDPASDRYARTRRALLCVFRARAEPLDALLQRFHPQLLSAHIFQVIHRHLFSPPINRQSLSRYDVLEPVIGYRGQLESRDNRLRVFFV